MNHKRWDGSAYQDIATFERWDGSAWQPVTTVMRWDGSAWVDTGWGGGGGGSLSATVSPATAETDSVVGDELVAEIVSESVVVTVSGGTGPYTYAWSRLSGQSAVECDSPTAATTTFSTIIYKGSSRDATFRCTITDSLSAETTVDVDVILTR